MENNNNNTGGGDNSRFGPADAYDQHKYDQQEVVLSKAEFLRIIMDSDKETFTETRGRLRDLFGEPRQRWTASIHRSGPADTYGPHNDSCPELLGAKKRIVADKRIVVATTVIEPHQTSPH